MRTICACGNIHFGDPTTDKHDCQNRNRIAVTAPRSGRCPVSECMYDHRHRVQQCVMEEGHPPIGHVKRTGHTVVFTVGDVTVYKPDEAIL